MDIGDLKYLAVPAKITKLSEAIRIGSKIRPQCYGYLFKDGASCALGAAWEGLGNDPVEGGPKNPAYNAVYNALYARFGSDVCYTVESRNDAGASREAVAHYLESQGY